MAGRCRSSLSEVTASRSNNRERRVVKKTIAKKTAVKTDQRSGRGRRWHNFIQRWPDRTHYLG